ncbi:MAG: class I SAM-dependent methyltransferase [Caldilineaceae bacterium SB0675_bin_29]|uniref:Class I SAM-dependent methyltransferase n=1 Tax=Caldilineaceae bacterium SB0675_bin_29 TaxID=2605266 RepID=A0A6B1FZ36_9CHLR|nr:class I SAM-dependent methyltransferase [Caldilineaceae bacterium SB0675_bin_29]
MTRETDLKGAVQEQFGRVAAKYLTSAVHAQGKDLPVMVEAANLQGNERVLDAGCGAGHTAASFAPFVAEVVALDFTASMLPQVDVLAQERGLANIETRLGDVENLPFPDSTFDLVVSRYSAHHWSRPGKALRGFHRVLRDGGLFILSDVLGFGDPVCDTYLNAIEVLRDPSHVRDYTLEEWSNNFAATGFHLEVVFPYRIFLHFEDWTERMETPDVYRAAIRALYNDSPEEVREALQIDEEGHSFQCAVLRGTAS